MSDNSWRGSAGPMLRGREGLRPGLRTVQSRSMQPIAGRQRINVKRKRPP